MKTEEIMNPVRSNQHQSEKKIFPVILFFQFNDHGNKQRKIKNQANQSQIHKSRKIVIMRIGINGLCKRSDYRKRNILRF